MPAFERAVHRVGLERLDADDLHVGPERLDVARDAGNEAAAAHRHEHRGEPLLAVAQDLGADGPLPRDHERVVEGMDERHAGFGDQRVAVRLRVAVGVARQHDLGAHAAHRVHLDPRRRLRHDDDRAQTELARGKRHALRVVAGARGDDAAGALLLGEMRDLVVGAAQLEAEDRLQILALEQHGVAETARESRRRIERRFARHVVDAAGQDVVERRGERRIQPAKSTGLCPGP